MALNTVFRTEETYGVVVVAADSVGAARVASAYTDTSDGGTVDPDDNVYVIWEYAQETHIRCHAWGGCLPKTSISV